MELIYHKESGKYSIGDKVVEAGYTLEVYDEVSKEWFKGRVGFHPSYDQDYFITLMTCGGGELGFVELKYYSQARIV